MSNIELKILNLKNQLTETSMLNIFSKQSLLLVLKISMKEMDKKEVLKEKENLREIKILQLYKLHLEISGGKN